MNVFQSDLEYGSEEFDTAEKLVTKMNELVYAHTNSTDFDKTRFLLQCFFAHMSIVCVFSQAGNEQENILFRDVVKVLSKDEHNDLVTNLKSLNTTNGEQKLFKDLKGTVERKNCSGYHKNDIPKITKNKVRDDVTFLLSQVVVAKAADQDQARQVANVTVQSQLIDKFKELQSITKYDSFSFPIDKTGKYIDSTKTELDEYKNLDRKAFGIESVETIQKTLENEVAQKLKEQTKAQENHSNAVTGRNDNNKKLTDLEKLFNLKQQIDIADYKTTLDEFGAIAIDAHKEKTITEFSMDSKIDFDTKKNFWIAFLKMAQLAFVINNYKTKITGEENVNFIEDTTKISAINIQAFLQMYTESVSKQSGGKQSGGKQSGGKQSGGKQRDSKQSNSKQKGGGVNCKYKYVKLLIEKIKGFNDKPAFDKFIASSTEATSVSSKYSKFYDKATGNQQYQNKNDQQISLCFMTVFGYSVDDLPVSQGDSEYKILLKTFLTRTRLILTDSDFSLAMTPTNSQIFTQTDIATPSMFSKGKLEDAEQKKFLQRAVVFFNNTNLENTKTDSNEYKSLDSIYKFITNINYLFGKIITQNNPAKTKVREGTLNLLVEESIKSSFNGVKILDPPSKKSFFSLRSGGSRKRNNKSGKKQLVRGGKKSIKHKISPNKTHKKQ